jgi:hypothetical protein
MRAPINITASIMTEEKCLQIMILGIDQALAENMSNAEAAQKEKEYKSSYL